MIQREMEASKKRYTLNIIRKPFRYLNGIDKIGLGFRTERPSKNSMGIVYYKDVIVKELKRVI